MASLKGMSVILAPHAAGRSGTPPPATPDSKTVNPATCAASSSPLPLSRRYARAYAAHFELWISACLRRQTVLARVPCKGDADGSPVRRSITAGGRGTLLNRTRTLYSPPSP